MIDRVANIYGDWLDRSKHQSDYLKLNGTMKKEEKFNVTQLFCGVGAVENDTAEEAEDRFDQ